MHASVIKSARPLAASYLAKSPGLRLVLGHLVLAIGLACPGLAHASEWPDLSLDQIVEKSGAIVMAKARVVDPAAYDSRTKEAFTRVEFDLVESLAGSLGAKRFAFLLRGGLRPDGLLEVDTLTSNFVEGETYLLFIKDGPYYVTPFVNGLALRKLNKGGRDVLADDDGHLVELTVAGARRGARAFESSRALLGRARGWDGFAQEESPLQLSAAGAPGQRIGSSAPAASNQPDQPAPATIAAFDAAASMGIQHVKAALTRTAAVRSERVRAPVEYRPRPEVN